MFRQQNYSARTIPALLAVLISAFLGLAPAAHAAGNRPIVGLWYVHYVSTSGGPETYTYDQWHSDGLEFEAANLAPGAVCSGTYKQANDGSYHNYHLSWTFDSTGASTGHWDEIMIVNVSADGQTYTGTYARNFYDTNGNFLFEDDGTISATRLSVTR